jgi:hypothetical protein
MFGFAMFGRFAEGKCKIRNENENNGLNLKI